MTLSEWHSSETLSVWHASPLLEHHRNTTTQNTTKTTQPEHYYLNATKTKQWKHQTQYKNITQTKLHPNTTTTTTTPQHRNTTTRTPADQRNTTRSKHHAESRCDTSGSTTIVRKSEAHNFLCKNKIINLNHLNLKKVRGPFCDICTVNHEPSSLWGRGGQHHCARNFPRRPCSDCGGQPGHRS